MASTASWRRRRNSWLRNDSAERDQEEVEPDQQQESPADFVLVVGEQPDPALVLRAFLGGHSVEGEAERAHRHHPLVRQQEVAQAALVAVALQGQRALHLLEPGVDELAQRPELRDLDRIVLGQGAQLLEILRYLDAGVVVGLEIGLVLGQQEAALPGLGVDHLSVDLRDLVPGILGVVDPHRRVPQFGKPVLGHVECGAVEHRREREHDDSEESETREIHGWGFVPEPTRSTGPFL